MVTQLYPHIVADPNILAGTPVVEGTQLPASTLVEQVANGKSLSEVAHANGVTIDDVRSALKFAAQRAGEALPSETLAPGSADAVAHADQKTAVVEFKAPGEPATDLGKRLAAIRGRIIASGTPLLSWDELDAEMDEMRRRDLDEREAE